MKNKLKPILAVALSLVLVACSTSQVILSLQAVVDAATVAIPLLPGVVSPQVITYIQAVNTATECAATELGTADSQAVKAAKIVGCFAQAAKPDLSGTSAEIVAIVGSVTAAVAAFLANYQPALVTAKGTTQVKVTMGDRSSLSKMHGQIGRNVQMLAGKR